MSRHRALAIWLLGLVAGCSSIGAPESTIAPTSPGAAGSGSPATASPPASVPSAGPSVSAAPSISSSVFAVFQYSDILQVEVNRLAVRQAPSLTSPQVQGYRSVGGQAEPTDDVRLNAGSFVSVQLGPLRDGDVDWYLVWPAENAQLGYNTGTWWDIDGDFATVGGVDPGWVAGSVGEDQYLTLYRRPESSEYESWPAGGPHTLMVSGTGDYDSGPQPQHDQFGFAWAVAVDEHASPCALAVTLVPNNGTEPVVALETSTTDVDDGDSVIYAPWSSASGDSFTLSITSGCTWTVGLVPHAHD